MNKLQSIFRPTDEEKITQYEFCIQCHMDSIGKCSTCRKYNPPLPDLPGFVEDRGSCKLNKDIFIEKICAGLDDDITCESYEEDTRVVEILTKEIERLKESEE